MRELPQIALIFVIGLLASAVILPMLSPPRHCTSLNACVAYLKMIDGAKAAWALENRKARADTPTESELFGPTNYIRDFPACPVGGDYSYILGRVDQRPRCSTPYHETFLACAEAVDESGKPVVGASFELQAGSSVIRGKTDPLGFVELKPPYCQVSEEWKHGTNRVVVAKRGYGTEKLPIPDLWPLRVVLKRQK